MIRSIRARMAGYALIALLAGGLGAAPASADGGRQHGFALLGDLKYPPGFKHYDYVNPDAPKGGTVRQYALGSFDSLNAFILKGRPAAGIGLIYDTLLDGAADEANTSYGLAAESLEVAADKKSVTFYLRPQARWHDGTPLTAEDVVFTFEALKTKGHPFYRAYYAAVAKAEAVDAHTVRFIFADGDNHELPSILGQLPVLPKAYFRDREFDKTTLDPPLGSGPYRVVAVDPGRSITYERVADYWGADIPARRGHNNFAQIRYDYYLDQSVALEAFKAHQYDFRLENSAKNWATGYDFPALQRGLVVKEELANEVPTGMQSFAFNLRRPMFQDRRVREAIGLAFDFEWANTNLFYGQYTRTESFFANSELASKGLPTPGELAILEKYRGQIPDEVFTRPFDLPETDGSGNARENLRMAKRLLDQAGYHVRNGKLIVPASGQPMEIEFLLADPQFERIVAPYLRNLERLGITGGIRVVDTAQYQNRMDSFDFDMVVQSFPQSLSPGNEQLDFWGSQKADVDGSRNVIGIRNPVVDDLIALIIAAPDRQALIDRTRALDRVLLWNHYVVPQWHITAWRVAYWNKFARPTITPKYGLGFDTWWVDAGRAAALQRGETQIKTP